MFISDELYKQVLQHTVIATVDLIFLNQDKQILLGKRTNRPLKGQYYLPGGRIDKGETMRQAAQRKANQETGIMIDPDRLIFVGAYDDIFPDSEFGDVSTHCMAITFVYHITSEEESDIKSDHQHNRMSFFAYHDDMIDSFLRKRLDAIQAGYSII